MLSQMEQRVGHDIALFIAELERAAGHGGQVAITGTVHIDLRLHGEKAALGPQQHVVDVSVCDGGIYYGSEKRVVRI